MMAGERVGRLVSVNVGLPRDVAWQGRTVHTAVWKEPVERSADGAPPEHRRRWPGRPCRTRRRAARGVRLPARLLPLLGARARPRRLRLRAVRGELHRRGPRRRPGVHRRPLPDRRRGLRGDPAARYLLPGRHPHGRSPDTGAAGGTSPAGVLLPGLDRGRGPAGRRDREARRGPGSADGRRSRRAALPARPPPPGAAARIAGTGAQPGLASLVPGDARPGR